MDEYLALKLGDVLAFTRMGVEDIEKGGDVLLRIIDPLQFEGIINELMTHLTHLRDIMENSEFEFDFLNKAATTQDKLEGMKKRTLGGEWENLEKLVRWLRVFEDAAISHWIVVRDVSRNEALIQLFELSQDAVSFHRYLLQIFRFSLEKFAKLKNNNLL